MHTKLLQKEQMNEVIALLNQGEVVAFATDTVFGVAVCYDNYDAINKMKIAKGRDEGKPFPMMVSSLEDIYLVANVDNKYEKLMKTLMPGALTIVVNKKESVPGFVTNDKSTIAIRMPDDAFVLSLISKMGKPLLVTSANLSGGANTSNTEEVLAQLDGRIACVVDGQSGGSVASTIVDLTTDEIKILREGVISRERIEECL